MAVPGRRQTAESHDEPIPLTLRKALHNAQQQTRLSLSSLITMASPNALFRWFAAPIAAALAVDASIYDVKGGSRAVIFDRLTGVQEKVVGEGTHFLIPWLQRSIIYDVRTKPRNISTTTGSKDLQMVSLTLRVLHRPEVPNLPKIYQVCFSSAVFLIILVNLLM